MPSVSGPTAPLRITRTFCNRPAVTATPARHDRSLHDVLRWSRHHECGNGARSVEVPAVGHAVEGPVPCSCRHSRRLPSRARYHPSRSVDHRAQRIGKREALRGLRRRRKSGARLVQRQRSHACTSERVAEPRGQRVGIVWAPSVRMTEHEVLLSAVGGRC